MEYCVTRGKAIQLAVWLDKEILKLNVVYKRVNIPFRHRKCF